MARWKVIFLRAVKGYTGDHCSSFAAGIAYYALLSIFPLGVFAVSIAGLVLRNDPGAQERVINALMNNLPLSGDARGDLADQLGAVAQVRGGLGLLGLLGTAYSASALFGALRSALNVVFRVERSRPVVQAKLLDLGMVIGLGTLVLLSLALTAVIAYVQNFSEQVFGAQIGFFAGLLFTLAYFVAPAIVSFALFLIAYKIIPHAEMSWRQAIPGAVVAALGFELIKIGFAQYVANFGNYDVVYGALGFVIVFLFFAYLSAQVMLLGGEFTRSYIEISTGAVPAAQAAVPKRPASIPQRAMAAVKGLFVSKEQHHDDRLPYQPARDNGPLTDQQAQERH